MKICFANLCVEVKTKKKKKEKKEKGGIIKNRLGIFE